MGSECLPNAEKVSRNVLFQLTGSISCYKACNIISKLVQNKYQVKTVATDAALEFIGKATLEGLTAYRVSVDMFDCQLPRAHIDLAEWADLIIMCPASADSINSLAAGLASDLPGAIFLANNFRKPYLLAPAMNTNMYMHPATQDALKKLENWGVKVLPTEEGNLACGVTGSGRLLSPEIIFQEIEKCLRKK
ncbi:MAG: flavoprotein [Candidatus Riflebacteria bacterium]|nr:flavoprotein [Candidatus Riflebacteria bacterium]